MGTVTDVAPAGLVPAAWVVTILAHITDLVSDRTMLIALSVMTVVIVAFLVVAYDEMDGPVLRAWRLVLGAGLVVTVAGVAGLVVEQSGLLAISLYGWMLLPGVAYIRTGEKSVSTRAPYVYVAAAGASLGGAAMYALGHLGGLEPPVTTFIGLAVVGVGQTAGIVTASYRNSGRDQPA